MKLINANILAREVVIAWEKQYQGMPGFNDVLDDLRSIDPEKITPEDVKKIIKNDSWCTPPRCSECDTDCDEVVQLGEDESYESNTVHICRSCLKEALALF